MTRTTGDSGGIEHLAEQYLDLLRGGESMTIDEFCAHHPKHADELRSLLPALAVLEGFRPVWREAIDEDSSDGVAFPEIAGYRIIGQIGRGGMGVVYEAEQESLGRRVAIKVVPRVSLTAAHTTQRFQREARAAAKMHHTHIVPVFEVGEDDDHLFYAMQLIDGQSLDHIIDDLRRLRRASPDSKSDRENESSPGKNDFVDTITRSLMHGRFQVDDLTENTAHTHAPAAASSSTSGTTRDSSDSGLTASSSSGGRFFASVARIGLQVADALSYSHARGIIHRDIKPGNLLLDGSGVVWVTDFGLAKVEEQDDLTRTGDIVGTVRYMSPERFSGQCDERADIYALGVTLYELLVLQPAFAESTRASLISSILQADPPSPRRIDRRIPRDLDTIILRAIDKDPRRRYASSTEFADDLRRFLRHEPVLARRVSPVERLWRWSRRNKRLAAALSAVVLLIVTLVISSNIAAIYFRQQKDAMQRHLYAAQMNLAGQSAMEPGGISRVLQLTSRWHPETAGVDLRGWEWYYLVSLCQQELFTLKGHTDEVRSISWSPDGTRLASSGYDHTIRLWDAVAGNEIRTLNGHTDHVLSVDWSPNGATLASASPDATVKVWDANTGETIRTITGHTDRVWSVGWSPDGTRIASAGEDFTVKVWDAASGAEIRTLEGHTRKVKWVSWSPDGSQLASVSRDDRNVKVWDVDTGAETVSLEGVKYFSWSPDGKQLALASGDGAVIVRDAATGDDTLTLREGAGSMISICWSPDGTQLAGADEDQTIRVWDIAIGKQTRTLVGHTRVVYSIQWSPDGTRLASASGDKTVKLWSAASRNETRTFNIDGIGLLISSVRWSPDGMRLALALGDGTVMVQDASTGEKIHSLKGHAKWLWSVGWSPDGSQLASAGGDNSIKVWDAGSGMEAFSLKGQNGVWCVRWSPCGRWLASASSDGTVRVWDIASGQETHVLKGHTDGVRSISWSPDSKRLASASHDHLVKVWDTATGKEVRTLKGHANPVESVHWSLDGTRLASGSKDFAVKVWDAITGREIRSLKGHTSEVLSVQWNPDGARLASSDSSGTVRVWETDTGDQSLRLKGHTSPVWVSWSPDGTRLASAGWDRRVIVWDATDGYERAGSR